MATITASRQHAGQAPAENHAPVRSAAVHTPASLQDLADGYDEIDAKLAALLLRTAALLADVDDR